MESINFTYPAFGLLFCLLAGLGYATLLYFRDKTFREQPGWFVPLLFGLRALSVSLICVLLLEPLLKRVVLDTRLPIVAVAQDVSASIGAGMEEATLGEFQQSLRGLENDLGQDYDLKYYSFGSEVRAGLVDSFQDKSTDIGASLQSVYDLHSDQNLGAIVLATDGRYNQGNNPLYFSENLGVPVFPVLLGDSIPKIDLFVRRVFHNQIAYLGDRLQVQVDLGARSLAGEQTSLRLSRVTSSGTRLVEERALQVEGNEFFRTLEFELEMTAAGVQRYRFSLEELSGEVSAQNNVKDIFIEVLDARQKVLVLAGVPHPDLTAIRQTLLKSKNYEVEIAYINRDVPPVQEFDFVIFHGLPSRTQQAAKILQTANEEGLPRLFILTGETDIERLNQVQGLVGIQAEGRTFNEVQPIPSPAFNLFNLSESLRLELPSFTPLRAPFGEYQVAPFASVVLYQRIGRVDTRFPLLVLGEEKGLRTGVLCGDGLWRWRLFDFLQRENHELFEELLGKTLQYVSLKDDKRKFRVSLPKNLFQETEAIPFNAELYNDNYELVNEPDVLLTIRSEETGDEFTYTFNKMGVIYSLNVGRFPVGNYTYEAATQLNGVPYEAAGSFSVQPIQLELYETTADFGGLRLIAQRTGGKAFFPDEMTQLGETLQELPALKPVVYSSVKTLPLLNLKWVFFVLVALLTGEWFLRRYFGAY